MKDTRQNTRDARNKALREFVSLYIKYKDVPNFAQIQSDNKNIEISTSDIQTNRFNETYFPSSLDMDDNTLQHDIEKRGLNNPINIYPTTLNNKTIYTIVTGTRRFLATIKNGHNKILCRVITPFTSEDAEKYAILADNFTDRYSTHDIQLLLSMMIPDLETKLESILLSGDTTPTAIIEKFITKEDQKKLGIDPEKQKQAISKLTDISHKKATNKLRVSEGIDTVVINKLSRVLTEQYNIISKNNRATMLSATVKAYDLFIGKLKEDIKKEKKSKD